MSNYRGFKPRHGFLSRFISQLQSIYPPPVMKQDLYLRGWSLLYLSQEIARRSLLSRFLSFLIRQLRRVLSARPIFRSRHLRSLRHHTKGDGKHLTVAPRAPIVRPNCLDIWRSRARSNLARRFQGAAIGTERIEFRVTFVERNRESLAMRLN